MDLKKLIILTVLMLFTISSCQAFILRSAQQQQVTVCELVPQIIRCPAGKDILITNVLYGRVPPLNLTLCNPYNSPISPTLNCVGDPTARKYVESVCNQQASCQVRNDWRQLGKDPCFKIPKYLKVDYTCIVPTTTSRTTTPTTPTTTRTSTTSTTTRTTTTPTTTRRSTTPTTTRRTTTSSTSTSSSTSTTTPTTTTRTTPTTTQRPTQAPFVPFNAPPGSQTCHDYLVTGKSGVKDSQLSASTVFGQLPDNNGPNRGRLFSDAVYYPNNGTYNRGSWVAAVNNQQQYIQVTLNAPSLVRGVATQGRHVNPNDQCCYQYVKKYRVMYSLDCVNFETVKDKNGNDKIFAGNNDQDSVITHIFDCPFLARCVRINPIEWKDNIAMRFDLFGCSSNAPDLGHCPKGWEELPGSNKCYLITDVHDMRTRDDASAQCQLQQAQLVKIDSIQERAWLRQKMAVLRQTQGQHHFWTGLENRPRLDSLYHKWTDGTPLDTNIMPWGNGQPDNSGGNEHCDDLWDGDLNDNDCNQHYPYICEKDKFWKPPVNKPTQIIVAPTTRPVPSTTAVAPPAVITYHVPTQKTAVQIGPNIFGRGCIKALVPDCSRSPAGNYQSCKGCHYYTTCAPNGVFTRPCPANLRWDDNLKTCAMISSTCQGP